jgi:hypothetical protein
MQGIKEKQKKQKILWVLCRAYVHGKGTHVARTCAAWEPVGVLPTAFAVRASTWAHGKATTRRTTTKQARQRDDARQRHGARQRVSTHGKVSTHGDGVGARQRAHARQTGNAHGNDRRTRQRPLPCVRGMAHGKDCVAVCDTAVRSLPSVDARQSRCRAFCALCRAYSTHGKAPISGSDFEFFQRIQTFQMNT